MRPGPARGETATMTVTVTADMAAAVAGRTIHPVYGTGALVAHVEEICRRMLEPHLEEGEEGVGYRLEVTHRSPAPVGAELEVVAAVAAVDPQRLLCEVTVRHGHRMVAHGSFEQRIVERERFEAAIREAAQRPATT